MKRRNFVAGLGAVAAGATGLFGTGAFTSVDAKRTATVEFAPEDEAFLAIFPSTGQPNSTFANQDASNGQQISLDFDDADGTEPLSEGVGMNSVYAFDDVFRVANQGTQQIYLDIPRLVDVDLLDAGMDGTQGDVTLVFYARDGNGDRQAIDGSNAELAIPTGEQRSVGVWILTDDESSYGNINSPLDSNQTSGTTATINADTTVDSGNAIDPGTPSPVVSPP